MSKTTSSDISSAREATLAHVSNKMTVSQSIAEVPIATTRVITVRAVRGGSITIPFNPRREALITENRLANLGDKIKKPFTGNSL